MKLLEKILIMIFIATSPVLADDELEEEPATLFGSYEIESGGYGAFEMHTGRVMTDEWGLFLGGKGGWVINSTFTIGGGGYGLVTMHELEGFEHIDTEKYDKVNIFMGWGGLMLEYTHRSYDMIHFTGDVIFGWGGVLAVGTMHGDTEINTENEITNDVFMMFQPGGRIEVNFYRWFRIGIGAIYRMPIGIDLKDGQGTVYATDNDFEGIAYSITFKFGLF